MLVGDGDDSVFCCVTLGHKTKVCVTVISATFAVIAKILNSSIGQQVAFRVVAIFGSVSTVETHVKVMVRVFAPEYIHEVVAMDRIMDPGRLVTSCEFPHAAFVLELGLPRSPMVPVLLSLSPGHPVEPVVGTGRGKAVLQLSSRH